MTVFKAFFKILNKNKLVVILSTIYLIGFGGFNMATNDNNFSFVASKPNVMIINNDNENKITNNLIKYISDNSNIKNFDSDKINDALFYRDVNYVIYIPKNYGNDFLNQKNPIIDIKSTKDYQASLAEMMLSRYLNVASIYNKNNTPLENLINKINETLEKESNVLITSKIDNNKLSKATFYYNFASFSILACLVYIICLITSSFKEINVKKRIIISSLNYQKFNKYLLLSNTLFAFILWLFYILLSFILVGDIMFTKYGLLYLINSLLFTICATTIAILVGNLVQNKNSISGIMNVISLGSSFLCGAFVPQEMLPDSVLKIAHLLPSYYYIKNNEIIKTLDNFYLKEIIINFIIIVIFILIIIILNNIITRKKQVII